MIMLLIMIMLGTAFKISRGYVGLECLCSFFSGSSVARGWMVRDLE